MIAKLDINGVHTVVTEDLKKYVAKKIGKLDRYLPKHSRKSVHAEVFLKERTIKTKQERECEVILHLPGTTLTAKETTVNMFAAVDIVEAKLKNQIKKHKDSQSPLGMHKRLMARLKRTNSQVES